MELTCRIDCRELTSRAAAHDCFARVFALPAFFGADAAAAIDAIFRYTMDVLRARGMAARNCPPEDYVAYMDQDLREDYLQAARLWQEARFRGRPMTEEQRRRVLRLKDEIWRRTWRNAGLRQRLRLKYVEFL